LGGQKLPFGNDFCIVGNVRGVVVAEALADISQVALTPPRVYTPVTGKKLSFRQASCVGKHTGKNFPTTEICENCGAVILSIFEKKGENKGGNGRLI
jgi:hypothetical protein